MKKRRWCVVPLVLVLLGAAACTDDVGVSGRGEQVESSAPSALPPPPSSPADLAELPVLKSRPVTVPIRLMDDTFSRVADAGVSRRYMLVPSMEARFDSEENPAHRVIANIVRIADKKRVAAVAPSRRNQLMHRSFFWGDHAIVQEVVNCSDPVEGCRMSLFRYDLTDGRRTEIVSSDGQPFGFLSAADLYGNVLAVAITKKGHFDDRCVLLVDIETGRQRRATCFPKGRIFNIHSGDGGFSIMYTEGDTIAECRVVAWLPLSARGTLGTGPVRRMGLKKTCRPFEHAHLDGWDVWSEIPKALNDEVDHSGGSLIAAKDGRVLNLGPVETNTAVPCGRHVYWNDLDPKRRGMQRLLRWRPGAGMTELVYEQDSKENTEAAEDDVALTFPACTDGVLSFQIDRSPSDDYPAIAKTYSLFNP